MRYGVLYVADAPETAFAETFGHDLPEVYAPAADKFVTLTELTERHLYRIRTDVELRPDCCRTTKTPRCSTAAGTVWRRKTSAPWRSGSVARPAATSWTSSTRKAGAWSDPGPGGRDRAVRSVCVRDPENAGAVASEITFIADIAGP